MTSRKLVRRCGTDLGPGVGGRGGWGSDAGTPRASQLTTSRTAIIDSCLATSSLNRSASAEELGLGGGVGTGGRGGIGGGRGGGPGVGGRGGSGNEICGSPILGDSKRYDL